MNLLFAIDVISVIGIWCGVFAFIIIILIVCVDNLGN